tara:strand:- start:3990 stop:4586 length:597 start_codon:yes stop_codon:yes gene_type:complete
MLEFTEEGHLYKWNGEKVLSVTQTLEPLYAYSGIPDHIMKAASERGTAVHLACEYLDNGVEFDISPEIEPYLEAWKTFLIDSQFECELVESLLYHPLYRYAGAVDRVGQLPGKGRGKKRRAIIDIKTTVNLMPTAGPQLAAYLEAFNVNFKDMPAQDRYVVQLKKDGTFKFHKHADKSDFQLFLSCQNIVKWKAANGY